MVLTMYRRLVLAVLLCLSFSFRSGAQEQDSTWYYANTLTDYATADLVCLVRVGETKILDTTGGYSIQEVSFEPIRFYKGASPTRKFRAWLESHEVVWKAGTVRGYYLLKGEPDPAHKSDQDSQSYYWLENAGFAVTDTPFIAMLADTGHLKQMIAQYILPEIAGSWAKVTLVKLHEDKNEDYGALNADIRLEADVPALHLEKGRTIPVTIWREAYRNQQELVARFQKKGTWEVVLYREEGQLNMKTLFMQEQ